MDLSTFRKFVSDELSLIKNNIVKSSHIRKTDSECASSTSNSSVKSDSSNCGDESEPNYTDFDADFVASSTFTKQNSLNN